MHERRVAAEEPGQEQIRVYTPPLRRRPRRRKSVYTHRPSVGRFLLALLFTGVLIGAGFLAHRYRPAQVAIVANNEEVATMATREEAEQTIILLQKKYAPSAPEVVKFLDADGDVVTLKVRPIKTPAPAMDAAEAMQKLDTRFKAQIVAWGIFVNGRPVVVVPNRDAVGETIAQMMVLGMRGKTGVPTLKYPLHGALYRQDKDKPNLLPVMTPDQAAAELVHPPRPVLYTVQRGDNFWKIATDHGLTLNQIKALNPTVDYTRLQPGDQVHLPDIQAPETIVARQQE